MNKFQEFLQKINFSDPSIYDFDSDEKVDKNILQVLKNINKSSWCWTLFSCEGHIVSEGAKTLPYFVFVVEKDKIKDLLIILFNTLSPKTNAINDFPLINSADIMLSWGFTDDYYAIVSAHWPCYFLEPEAHDLLMSNFLDMSIEIMEKNYE